MKNLFYGFFTITLIVILSTVLSVQVSAEWQGGSIDENGVYQPGVNIKYDEYNRSYDENISIYTRSRFPFDYKEYSVALENEVVDEIVSYEKRLDMVTYMVDHEMKKGSDYYHNAYEDVYGEYRSEYEVGLETMYAKYFQLLDKYYAIVDAREKGLAYQEEQRILAESIEVQTNNDNETGKAVIQVKECSMGTFFSIDESECLNRDILKARLEEKHQKSIDGIIEKIKPLLNDENRQTYFNFLKNYVMKGNNKSKKILAEYLYWFTE